MSVNYQVYAGTTDHAASSHSEAERLLENGIEVLTQGDTLSALDHFEKAFHINNSPLISSYYAFCIAKELRQFSRAIELCTDAIKKDPQNPFHYLNLGRIHLLSNGKEDAAKVFREGLKSSANLHVCDRTKAPEAAPATTAPQSPLPKKGSTFGEYVGSILNKLRRS